MKIVDLWTNRARPVTRRSPPRQTAGCVHGTADMAARIEDGRA